MSTDQAPSRAQQAGVGELVTRLRRADSLEEVTQVIAIHGWTVPLVFLGIHGLIRGGFEYLTDPFVIAEGYRFPGWQFAVVANLVYGFFIVTFAWFMFFGLVGSFAGYLSDVREMDTALFKFGAYLSMLFVPVFIVGSVIVLTITVPESALDLGLDESTVGPADPGLSGQVHDTLQYHVVSVLRAAAWAIIGFLVLPIVKQRYELTQKQSVLAVLPVTLVALVSTQLV